MASIVLTVIGDDQPGLVDKLSAVIAEHGGNWEESRMAQLAGKFAGILRVSVADAQAEALTAAFQALDEEGLLHITAAPTDDGPAQTRKRALHLELVGQDHPGIVHDISHALAKHDISIEELTSHTESASMAGGNLFLAEMRLSVPESVTTEALRGLLEGLANELMVDINLEVEN